MSRKIEVHTINGIVSHPMTRFVKAAHKPTNPTEFVKRIESNLSANPCPLRGEQLRVAQKQGSCSCSTAPVFGCSAEQNQAGEASLWQFSRSQTLPCCRKCEWRPEPTT